MRPRTGGPQTTSHGTTATCPWPSRESKQRKGCMATLMTHSSCSLCICATTGCQQQEMAGNLTHQGHFICNDISLNQKLYNMGGAAKKYHLHHLFCNFYALNLDMILEYWTASNQCSQCKAKKNWLDCKHIPSDTRPDIGWKENELDAMMKKNVSILIMVVLLEMNDGRHTPTDLFQKDENNKKQTLTGSSPFCYCITSTSFS